MMKSTKKQSEERNANRKKSKKKGTSWPVGGQVRGAPTAPAAAGAAAAAAAAVAAAAAAAATTDSADAPRSDGPTERERRRAAKKRNRATHTHTHTPTHTHTQTRIGRKKTGEDQEERQNEEGNAARSEKMAARDDSPTSLHGQPWSVWADRLGRDSPLSASVFFSLTLTLRLWRFQRRNPPLSTCLAARDGPEPGCGGPFRGF